MPATGTAYEGRVLALLPEEPAGRISTRNAGAISFRATLTRHSGGGIPSGPVLKDPAPGARFYSLAQTEDVASATQEISCEIRALYAGELSVALDAVLRSLTAHAALTEAVLETRAIRLADPSITPAPLAEELARQLSGTGLRVSSGPSWTPSVPGADASVGTRGFEDAFETFLRAHPAWQPRWRSSPR